MVQLVRVIITLKDAVLDVQGETVARSLHSLQFNQVEKVRIGKIIFLEINKSLERELLEKKVKEMCESLLCNNVMEDFKIEIVENGAQK